MKGIEVKYQQHASFNLSYFVPYTKQFQWTELDIEGNVGWKPLQRSIRSFQLTRDNKHQGKISRHAKVKLRNALTTLKVISKPKTIYRKNGDYYTKFKLNFMTLDIPYPQLHSDKFITDNILNVFLQWLKRFKGFNSYVWKAETQGNGCLHFHVTGNMFVHWKSVANKWDDLLSRYGYYNNGKNTPNAIQSASTSIKAVVNDGLIVSYMCKYICKSEETDMYCERYCDVNESERDKMNHHIITEGAKKYQHKRRPVDCSIWRSSYNLLKAKFNVNFELVSDAVNILTETKLLSDKVFESDFFQIYYMSPRSYAFADKRIYDKWKDTLREVCKGENRKRKFVIDIDKIEKS